MTPTEQGSDNKFTITRVFEAPRELLFKIWTDPNHLKKWMSPGGFAVEYRKAEIRPQGVAHYCMTGANNVKMWGKVQYREITAPSRLVYAQYFSDENEGITRHPMSATWPLEMLTTVVFEAVGNKTKVTLTWELTPSATSDERDTFSKAKSGMSQGWGGTFAQLENYLTELGTSQL